jgi:hypothetical protein
MGKHQSDSRASKKSRADIDWDNRVLCSDGNCIGIIGPDGNCKECGKAYEGKLPWGKESGNFGHAPEESYDSDARGESEETVEDADTDSGDEKNPDDNDWGNRKLCSDGNCIGVIGPDGRCKECGKPYEGD